MSRKQFKALVLTLILGSNICLLIMSIKWEPDLYWQNQFQNCKATFLIFCKASIRFFQSLLFDSSKKVWISVNYWGNWEIFEYLFLGFYSFLIDEARTGILILSTTSMVFRSGFPTLDLAGEQPGLRSYYTLPLFLVISSQTFLKQTGFIFPFKILYQSPRCLQI